MSQSSQFSLLETAPLRPVFLDPVPGRHERQRVQGRLLIAGHLSRRAVRQRGPGLGSVPDLGDLHRAVRAAVGHQRADRRPHGQGPADPPGEDAGDRHHGDRLRGLCAAPGRAAVPVHLPDGRALDAVRAGQIRLLAAAPATVRTGGRQRPGGDGHLRRHPARHHRRRRTGQPDAQRRAGRPGADRHRLPGDRRRRLADGARRARVAGLAAGSAHQLEPRLRDLAQPGSWPATSARCS